jgi:hypothetical protein
MALSIEEKNKLVSSGAVKNYSGKSWDEIEKLISSGSNEGNRINNEVNNIRTGGSNNTSNKAPTTTEQLYEQNPYNRYGLQNVIDTGNAYMITDAKGRKVTITKRAIEKNGLQTYLDDYGNFIDKESKSSGNSSNSYNNSNRNPGISDMYDEQRKSLIAQLKSSIAKAKGQYTDIIKKAPQTYQPLRNQNEVTKEQQLASMREALANQGNTGGTGRQELLGINTAAGNRMNDINLQQQNVINDANSAISSLDQEAAFKESEITADTAAQKLQALLAENTRVDELNREQERYAQEYADRQKQQEFENSLTQQKYNDNLAAQQLEREINSIGAYSNDYMAEIQRRQSTGDTADDALIPYLQAARNEKIAQQRAQADNTSSQAYKNAYQLWLQLGVATQEIADILGIPKGSKTLDKIKADYSTAKPYYSPNTGGSSGGSSEIPWYLQ